MSISLEQTGGYCRAFQNSSGRPYDHLQKPNGLHNCENFIIPLQKEYHVEFDHELIREVKSGDPERKILLQEKGDYLIIPACFFL